MTITSGSGPGRVDLHSHVIPDVDDGARSLEGAMQAVGRMTAVGIGTLVATPHLDASLTLDPTALQHRLNLVDEAFFSLAERVRSTHPELDLRRGFEVALDVPEIALEDERLFLGGSRAVLVEWPRMQVPPGTTQVLQDLVSRNVRPVIAHAERYVGSGSRVGQAREWKSVGAVIQVNYGSLVGRYGAQPRSDAFRLLRAGLVDVLATDYHARAHLRLHVRSALDRLSGLGAVEHLDLLTSTNPRRVLRDEETVSVPPLEASGFWGKVRNLFHAAVS